MINYIKKGNIFESKCEVLVCPVNCFGVMGAGLAKAFATDKKFKETNLTYQRKCEDGLLAPGSCCGVQYFERGKEKSVVYLATKYKWQEPSKLSWIQVGTENLEKYLNNHNVESVAVPAIGAGLGQVDWQFVKKIFDMTFKTENRLYEVYKPL